MSTDQRWRHKPILPEANASGFSRTLIYLPIVHTQADMGALKESVARSTLEKTGRVGLARKIAAIDQIWTDIEAAIEALALSFDRVRLYQDGLPVCGREAEIVTELAQAGSRNHQLLLRLMGQGARLMGTESGDLLVQEYQLAKQSLTTRPPRAAAVAAQRRALSEALLQRRDQFMAQRINDTLKNGETGILFLGMLHSLERYLQPDVKVIYPLQRPR
ncbi:MAG TPA: hypothetical protein VJA64_07675 [Desulfobaccales bacterium]|nr:hypothetical protein [Desulfobaccales bacterium]